MSWFGEHSEEAKKKMSETRKRLIKEGKIKTWNKGIPHKEETKKKISQRVKERGGMSGKNNPMFGKHHPKETIKKISKIHIEGGKFNGKNNPMYGKRGEKCPHYGKKYSEDRKRNMSKTRIKKGLSKLEKNPMWAGGKSFEPYTREFNNDIKEKVKKRDEHCILCGIGVKELEMLGKTIHIHHIDYDKKNNIIQNLIPLCHSCHSKTNWNREYWIGFFQSLLSERYGNGLLKKEIILESKLNVLNDYNKEMEEKIL